VDDHYFLKEGWDESAERRPSFLEIVDRFSKGEFPESTSEEFNDYQTCVGRPNDWGKSESKRNSYQTARLFLRIVIHQQVQSVIGHHRKVLTGCEILSC
jgi:hypothetical protein